jgi:hypothetical protein
MRRDSIDGVQRVIASRVTTGERLRTYVEGRIRAPEGCRTRLSRYNPSTRCSIH